MSRRRVLVLTSTFPRRRGDTWPPFVYELSKRLVDADMEVAVLAPYARGAAERETLDGMQVHRFRYWLNRGPLLTDTAILRSLQAHRWLAIQIPFFVLLQLAAVRRLARAARFDVIHAHWLLPQGLVAVLYKRLFDPSVRVVATLHGGDVFGLAGLDGLKRRILRGCDAVSVVSHGIEAAISQWSPATRPAVIPMGVDETAFHPDQTASALRAQYAADGPLLLYAGRLSEKKGVRYLLQAMPAILHEIPRARLLIVGDGEDRGALERLAGDLAIRLSVVFAGPRANAELPAYYASADLFIGPSVIAQDGDREGLPVTYMEAMACGCPVIGTDLEGNRDLLVDGVNGLMVRQKDPAAIAEAVLRILRDPELKTRLAGGGRETVERAFSWTRIGKRYAALLDGSAEPMM